MSTDLGLWILFALFSLALVLVVVTARRGPWDEHRHRHHVHVPFDQPTVVDPLWGKNPPESW